MRGPLFHVRWHVDDIDGLLPLPWRTHPNCCDYFCGCCYTGYRACCCYCNYYYCIVVDGGGALDHYYCSRLTLLLLNCECIAYLRTCCRYYDCVVVVADCCCCRLYNYLMLAAAVLHGSYSGVVLSVTTIGYSQAASGGDTFDLLPTLNCCLDGPFDLRHLVVAAVAVELRHVP